MPLPALARTIVLGFALGTAAFTVSCGDDEPEAGTPERSMPEPVSERADSGAAPGDQTAPPAAATPPARTEAPAGEAGAVEAAGVTFDLPEGWVSEAPENTMRLAQIRLPAPEGVEGEDGVVTVFALGGGVEMNIQRWIDQMSNHEGEPQRREFNVNGLKVYEVVVTGTFASGMPGGATTPVSDTMLLGAVVTGGAAEVQIKATGPLDVMTAHRERWNEMLGSLRRSGGGGGGG